MAKPSVASLTPDYLWLMNMDLALGEGGRSTRIQVQLRFEEEEGFEPPQGFVTVESFKMLEGTPPNGTLTLGKQQGQRWLLSEDPDDRKDSFWIWGLFEEPLYPFILFDLELGRPIELEGNQTIPAGMLSFQAGHKRKDGQTQLGEGTVVYKKPVKFAGDLIGLSEVSYMEPVPCGTCRFLVGS